MGKAIFTFTIAILMSALTFAQQDAEGCKDHPLFTRLPNFYIEDCQQNYNAIDFLTGLSGSKENMEGNITTIRYTFQSESGAKKMSPLQIVRNYENAIVAKGGKKIYTGSDDVDGGPYSGTFSMSSNGKEYWVSVRRMYEGQITGEVDGFSLIVLEKEAMKQDVEANEMFKKINESGSIALYINFETGKSDIKPESQKIVEQIADMLKANPTLKISIEGYTDNVGNPAANKTLSENRAKAVMNAVIAQGIDKTRLSAKGWGQDKPISDNSTEDGKAKNRRVDIVKL